MDGAAIPGKQTSRAAPAESRPPPSGMVRVGVRRGWLRYRSRDWRDSLAAAGITDRRTRPYRGPQAEGGGRTPSTPPPPVRPGHPLP
uniref:hypothetical protein n=1 Tax=Streptomyces sp. MSC1_001 TaxID=2909263 RepID=UPI0020305308